MRVAVLGIKDLPASAGADRVVEKLLENLPTGDDYYVYLMKRGGSRLTCAHNLHYVYVPFIPGKHLAPFSFFLLCSVHYLVKGRYDIAHVHNSDFGLFCALLRLKRRIPVLGTFHGDPYLRGKWGRFARAYLRLSERFFVEFSNRLTSVARRKERVRGLWSQKDVEFIPNGVETVATDGARIDWGQLGVRPGEFLLFACGRLDPTKGLHHLLSAYAESRRPEKLLVIGDFSHDREYAESIRRTAAADGRVVIHSRLMPRALLLEVVRACKLFVFPSEVEGMSMMLLEAVSCRAPVVVSDIPENIEVVGESYPHRFASNDPHDLRRKLERVLETPGASTLAEELHQRCVSDMGWPVIAAAYRERYASLLDRSCSGQVIKA